MDIQQTVKTGTATTAGTDQFDAYISPVADLLHQKLCIPSYQRPYTWSVKNVRQLVSDIQHFRSAGHYRLGTFILHEPDFTDSDAQGTYQEPGQLEIVDGQQRYLTFGLIILALSTRSNELDQTLSEPLLNRMQSISIPQRRDGKSETNLRTNYDHLLQVVRAWSVEELSDFTEFFLKECSVVVMEVKDLDSAFQLFDSQNTRGKALYPTDLLKAHHLREFTQTSSSREAILDTVRKWDAHEPAEIEHLFASVLFPIKRWTANEPVPDTGFRAEHVDMFKGIRQTNTPYRWSHMALMAKATVDHYRATNATLRQYGVVDEFEFPFQILQPIIDGEMFFRMVDHYIAETRKAGIRRISKWDTQPGDTEPAKELVNLLAKLDELPSGIGNRYTRELFDCLLMAFIDRFGWHDVRLAADKLVKRAYGLRAKLQRINKQSINIHARDGHSKTGLTGENIFAKIALAETPDDVLTLQDPNISEDDKRRLKSPFQKLFASVAKESIP